MLSALVLVAALSSAPSAGVSIAPAVVSSAGNAVATYSVGNAGNVTEHIVIQVLTTRPVANNPKVFAPDSEYDHYTVSVPEFNLKPQDRKTVQVTIHTDGTAQHLIVAAEASVPQNGFAKVHASVLARWNVTGKPAAPRAAVTLPQPVPPSHGVPIVLIGLVSLLLGALAGVGRYLQLRRRRRTA